MASTAQDSSAPLRTEKKDEDVDESAFFGRQRMKDYFFPLFFQCRSRNHALEVRRKPSLFRPSRPQEIPIKRVESLREVDLASLGALS